MKLPLTDSSQNIRRRVVKVGGSLFEFDGLSRAFVSWLARQSPAQNVLLAGGGPMADEIRRTDSRFRLGEETCHWLCVDVLNITAQLLARILPETRMTNKVDALGELERSPTIVFAPATFLREIEPSLPGRPLPHRWSATTDSIAARIAQWVCAEELVLLKSSDPPPHDDWSTLARDGFVDDYFPQAVGPSLQVRLVNLRAAKIDRVQGAG